MEIGVYSGGSLEMWHHYFGSECWLYGVDIEPACRAYQDDRTQIFIGDQADPAFWSEFIVQVPMVDVVIDDGGHQPTRIVTLEALLPHIRPGGVYLCEDMHRLRSPFCSYVIELGRQLNSLGTGETGFRRAPTDFQRTTDSVHLYPFVVVIEKRQKALTELRAPKRGTEWQPHPTQLS